MVLSAKLMLLEQLGEQFQRCNTSKPIPKVDLQQSFNIIRKNCKNKSGKSVNKLYT
jgi:hypothetical protein